MHSAGGRGLQTLKHHRIGSVWQRASANRPTACLHPCIQALPSNDGNEHGSEASAVHVRARRNTSAKAADREKGRRHEGRELPAPEAIV